MPKKMQVTANCSTFVYFAMLCFFCINTILCLFKVFPPNLYFNFFLDSYQLSFLLIMQCYLLSVFLFW